MDTKVSVLTGVAFLVAMVSGFVSLAAMNFSLHVRIKELERKVGGDAGSGDGS